MARRSGTAGTVRHAPGLKYGQMNPRTVFCAEIEEEQYLSKQTLTEVRERKKRGVQFP